MTDVPGSRRDAGSGCVPDVLRCGRRRASGALPGRLVSRCRRDTGAGVGLIGQKYGGSSVADAEGIKRVAHRVVDTKKAGNDVVVIVSAMGDTTDDLLDLARAVSPTPAPRELDMLLTAGERISS